MPTAYVASHSVIPSWSDGTVQERDCLSPDLFISVLFARQEVGKSDVGASKSLSQELHEAALPSLMPTIPHPRTRTSTLHDWSTQNRGHAMYTANKNLTRNESCWGCQDGKCNGNSSQRHGSRLQPKWLRNSCLSELQTWGCPSDAQRKKERRTGRSTLPRRTSVPIWLTIPNGAACIPLLLFVRYSPRMRRSRSV